jgi:hypothetical protein
LVVVPGQVEIDPGQDVFTAIGVAINRLMEMPEDGEIHGLWLDLSGPYLILLIFPVVQAFQFAEMEDILLSLGVQRCRLRDHVLADMAGDLFFFLFFHFLLSSKENGDVL